MHPVVGSFGLNCGGLHRRGVGGSRPSVGELSSALAAKVRFRGFFFGREIALPGCVRTWMCLGGRLSSVLSTPRLRQQQYLTQTNKPTHTVLDNDQFCQRNVLYSHRQKHNEAESTVAMIHVQSDGLTASAYPLPRCSQHLDSAKRRFTFVLPRLEIENAYLYMRLERNRLFYLLYTVYSFQISQPGTTS